MDALLELHTVGLQLWPTDLQEAEQVLAFYRANPQRHTQLCWCRVCNPSRDPISGQLLDPAVSELLLDLASKRWVYRVWRSMPGPMTHEFYCRFEHYGAAVQAIRTFYTGAPTSIAGWPIPLHRHPELHQAPVEHAIAQAVRCSPQEFLYRVDVCRQSADQTMQRWWRATRDPLCRWKHALQSQFLQIAHPTDSHTTLYLRRDAAEAAIVSDRVGK